MKQCKCGSYWRDTADHRARKEKVKNLVVNLFKERT